MDCKLTTTQIDDEPLIMSPIQRAMVELQLERQSGYNTSLVKEWPSLRSFTSLTFIGSFAWTSPSVHTRLLAEKTATMIGAGWCSPADIARDYIRVKYGKPGRITSKQYQEIMIPRSAPLLANPGIIEEAVYLDLKAAYWSILQVIGWDVDYMPNQWLGVNTHLEDFPFPENKLARNSLVSVGLIGQSKVWDGEKLITWSKRNPLANMMLWSAVQDVLNGVALDMERAGAQYIHTDGYIFPADKRDDALRVADSWGLVLTQRHEGRAHIFNPGNYDIGNHIVKHRNRTRESYFRSIESRANLDWLRKRFLFFANKVSLRFS